MFELKIAVTCSKIGTIMDNDESASQYNHFYDRSAGKSYFGISNCYLYFCCYWNAIVFRRLHGGKILSGSCSQVSSDIILNKNFNSAGSGTT